MHTVVAAHGSGVCPIAVPQGDVGRVPQSGPLWPATSKVLCLVLWPRGLVRL